MQALPHVIKIRVSAEDKALFEAEAAKEGLSLSSWARRKLKQSGGPIVNWNPGGLHIDDTNVAAFARAVAGHSGSSPTARTDKLAAIHGLERKPNETDQQLIDRIWGPA